MYYIYGRTKSGREIFVNVYDEYEEALAAIRRCYNTDAELPGGCSTYYFMKEH